MTEQEKGKGLKTTAQQKFYQFAITRPIIVCLYLYNNNTTSLVLTKRMKYMTDQEANQINNV